VNRDHTWTCATCHVEIRHRPVFHVGLAFCCAGCVADGPCSCSYDEEPIDDPAEAEPRALPIVADDQRRLVRAAR
jgi:hypothetical protein